MMTRVALQFLRDTLCSIERLEKLKARLHELVAGEGSAAAAPSGLAAKRSALEKLEADLVKVERNLGLAENPQQFRAIGNLFDELKCKQEQLRVELRRAEAEVHSDREPDELVAAALSLLHRLPDLVDNDANLAAVGRAFSLVNLRIFLRFEKLQVKRRPLNKVSGGVITFGNAPPPITLYRGPTGRRALQSSRAAAVAAGPEAHASHAHPDSSSSGREGNSLRNVNRGDKI